MEELGTPSLSIVEIQHEFLTHSSLSHAARGCNSHSFLYMEHGPELLITHSHLKNPEVSI